MGLMKRLFGIGRSKASEAARDKSAAPTPAASDNEIENASSPDPRARQADEALAQLAVTNGNQAKSADAMEAEATRDLAAFVADPRHSRFNEVRERMAALIEGATNRGETMSLDKAYALACQFRDRGWETFDLMQAAEQGDARALFKLGLMQLSGKGAALDTVSGVVNLFGASFSGVEGAREAIETIRPTVPADLWPTILGRVKWPDLIIELGPLVEGHLDTIRISQENDDGSDDAEWLRYEREQANAMLTAEGDGKGSLLDTVFGEKVSIKEIFVGRSFRNNKVCTAISINLRNIELTDGFPVYWTPAMDAFRAVANMIALMDARTWVGSFYDTLAIEPSIAPNEKAIALFQRGLGKWQCGVNDGAMADFDAVIKLPDAPAEQVAKTLYNRGVMKDQRGDSGGAIADFSAVISLPNAPAEEIARALYSRGITRTQRRETGEAIADYSAIIAMTGAPVDYVALALYNRAHLRSEHGDSNGAIGDFSAVIALPDAPAEQVAQALLNRGFRKGQCGDIDGKIADYNSVIALPNAPVDQVALALHNRGLTKGHCGDSDAAIADFSAVISLRNAPVALMALALNSRGIARGQQGDSDGAIADFSTVIVLPNAPVDQMSLALNNRGIHKDWCGDSDGAIADFSTLIALPNVPTDQVARALSNRAVTKYRRGDREGARTDWREVIALPNAPVNEVEAACRWLQEPVREHLLPRSLH